MTKNNHLDKAIEWISPGYALKRTQARHALAYYEAAKPGRERPSRKETGSANAPSIASGQSLREQALYLEENHDLAKGILDVLVRNVIGPQGIGVEAMPRRTDGTIHQEFAGQIEAVIDDWAKCPEVTRLHDWPGSQRIAARSWFRDGEMFARQHAGHIPSLDHGTRVPYSLELMEASAVPLDFPSDTSPRIIGGIEINGWGRPVGYHFHRTNPASLYQLPTRDNLKRVSAAEVLHPAMRNRIGQYRGVSIFASVITRLEDLKDYENSERIAAKVAASMAGYIKKGNPDQYNQVTDSDGLPVAREMKFVPGMVFDNLREGEDIGTIDTTRPNAQLEPHRNGQLKAISAGTCVTYSSAAKDYSGTFSSQRQELVEGYGSYGVLSSDFTNSMVRPVIERIIDLAILAKILIVPQGIDTLTLHDAMYIPPQMPWIDPVKEANAWGTLEANGHASGPEIIRKRGLKPKDLMDQEERWRNDAESRGLSFDCHGESEPEPQEQEEQEENDEKSTTLQAMK